jgi:transposase
MFGPKDILSKSTKNLGAIALIKPILDGIGIKEIVDGYAPMERERGITNGDAIEVMVLNRLTSPTPLYSVEEWARVHALEEAFGIAPDEVNYDRLARALDAISTKIEDIEADISLRMMSKYRIKPEIVHLDASSLYFEGAYEDSDLVRLGYSRDQKPDKKQVNVALDVDASEGMPLFHTIHNGNTPDPTMAVANLKRIRERLKPDRMIVVGDRSAMDGEVALMLRDYGLDFVGAVKMTEKAKKLVASIPDEEFKPLNVEDYSAAESTVQFSHDGRRMGFRGVVVLSRRKAEQDAKKRSDAISEIESEFRKVQAKLNKRRWRERDLVQRKVESILRKKSRYAPLLKTEVKGDYGNLSFKYSVCEDEMKSSSKLDGKYVLATTLNGWRAEKIFKTYRSRYLVEARIRNMKSEIAVRPIFLHDEGRIRALVFVSILALMVYSLIEILARRSGMGRVTTRRLLFVFQKISVIELKVKGGVEFRLVEDLTAAQGEILDRLKLKMPASYIKTVVQ